MYFSVLIIAYLFLAGAGSGALLVALCLEWRSMLLSVDAGSTEFLGFRIPSCQERDEALGDAYGIAGLFAIVGTACLFFDLARPELVGLLFLKPRLSFITFGAFAITALLVSSLSLAGVHRFPAFSAARRMLPVFRVVGGLSALGVMLYTGLFLYSIYTISAWHTPWVPVLFVVSSTSSGLAIVFASLLWNGLARAGHSVIRQFAKADMALIAIEAICTMLFVAYLLDNAPASAQALLEDSYQALFLGGYVFCGMVVPLGFNVMICRYGSRLEPLLVMALLFGAACLRASIVFAGLYS